MCVFPVARSGEKIKKGLCVFVFLGGESMI